MGAPVGHTCRTIDGIIDSLTNASNRLNSLNDNSSVKEIFETIADVSSDLGNLWAGRHSAIEEVRGANAELRSWGEKLEEDIEELKAEIRSLEQEKAS